MRKNIHTTITLLLFTACASAQYPRLSIASDVGMQQNFKREQRYFVVGHNTAAHLHLSQKDGVFVTFSYFGKGKYTNRPVAVAKTGTVTPQELQYTNTGLMRVKEFSLGYRRYLAGHFEEENKVNIYATGAFGLMYGRVTNTHNVIIDTNFYYLPVQAGNGKFKRLTLDLGLGAEHYVGGDFYFFGEARIWIPTTDYPSKYLFVNDNAPMMAMLGLGFRILF